MFAAFSGWCFNKLLYISQTVIYEIFPFALKNTCLFAASQQY